MPPAILALAPLAASALGSTLLPAVAGSTLMGIGTSTLGGLLGGGLAGALTSDDPLIGGLTGAVGGALGGAGLAEGIGSLAGGVGDALGAAGTAGEAIATGAPTDLLAGAAGAGAEAGGGAGVAAGGLAESAGTLASPTAGALGTTTGLESSTLGGAFTGSDLTGALGAAGTAGEAGGGIASVLSPASDLGTVGDIALATPAVGGGGAASAVGAAGDAGAAAPDWLARNKDWLLPAAGVAATAASQASGGDDMTRDLRNLAQSNANIAAQGVPPGVTAGIKSAAEAAKARVRSMFASTGMSGSSSEAVALANIDQTAAKHGGELAMGLVAQGLQANQMNAGIYQILLKNALEQDKALSESIGRFTQSLAA